MIPKNLKKKREALFRIHSKDFMITDSLQKQNNLEKKEVKKLSGLDYAFNQHIKNMIGLEKNPKKSKRRKKSQRSKSQNCNDEIEYEK